MVALTSKQEKFVLEYIKDFDNIQAYLRAFPNASYDTAKVQSNRWMNNEEVRQAISDLVKEYIDETITENRILIEVQLMAFDRELTPEQRLKALSLLGDFMAMKNKNLKVDAKVDATVETVITVTIEEEEEETSDNDERGDA